MAFFFSSFFFLSFPIYRFVVAAVVVISLRSGSSDAQILPMACIIDQVGEDSHVVSRYFILEPREKKNQTTPFILSCQKLTVPSRWGGSAWKQIIRWLIRLSLPSLCQAAR